MNKKDGLQLTEGSKYKVYSIGGREHMMETEGIFTGFAGMGIDEAGIVIEITAGDPKSNIGTQRIIPLHSILAIDILHEKPNDIEDEKEPSHYYG